ncbi:MAG TPA: CoA transferase [Steroidobacteraceae bacterium]|nr:CoA transferase [Steroidobacteraceae bacterium]
MLPLENIRVIELGRVLAAPLACQILADLGADVIKVEHPGDGDMFRTAGPGFVRDASGHVDLKNSGKFQALNRNKRAIAVDIAKDEGSEIVRELARRADVFVENFKVGDLARRGLDYGALSSINPAIIYASVTGFGQTGPYAQRAGLDPVAQAMSGFMSLNGERGGPPLRSAVNVMDYSTGLFAAIGIIAALYHRKSTGVGQHLDVSLLESGLSMMAFSLIPALLDGRQPPRAGSRSVHWVPSGVFDCADAQMYLVCGPDRDFARLCDVLGRPEWRDDVRFSTRGARDVNEEELISLVGEVLRTDRVSAWVEKFSAAGLVAAPIYEFADVVADPQIRARGVIRELPHGSGGSTPTVESPIRFSAIPPRRHVAAPLHGQHTDEVLGNELGYSPERIACLRESGVC